MPITITDVGGTTTVGGRIDVQRDLKVEGNLNITGHLVVSGDIHIEDDVTEGDAVPVRERFALVIPGVPLAAATPGYTVAPCALSILAIYAVTTVEASGDAVLTLAVAGAAHGETLTIAGAYTGLSLIGDVNSKIFNIADTADQYNKISVYTTSLGVGTVNVTLICEAT